MGNKENEKKKQQGNVRLLSFKEANKVLYIKRYPPILTFVRIGGLILWVKNFWCEVKFYKIDMTN